MTKVLAMVAAVLLLITSAEAKQPLTDQQIRQILIQQSIASYPGRCPCPYNTMRNGHSCGGRSAWSKPGGYSPLCYPQDVSKGMVEAFRQRTNN